MAASKGKKRPSCEPWKSMKPYCFAKLMQTKVLQDFSKFSDRLLRQDLRIAGLRPQSILGQAVHWRILHEEIVLEVLSSFSYCKLVEIGCN